MTLLRAIPFSFSVLWRWLLVLPFMLIAILVFVLVAAIISALVMFVSPMLGGLVVMGFVVAGGVMPVILGARLALQAKRVSMRNSFFGLMLPAIGYGLFEAFCVMLIFAGCAGAYLIATPLSFADLGQFAAMDQAMLLDQLFSVSPEIVLSILWVGGVLIIGLRAALLMPFAGASIGMDPVGRPHTPFYGFGAEFMSLFVLAAIACILSILAVPIAVAICAALGFGDALTLDLAQIQAEPSFSTIKTLGKEAWIFFGICLLCYLWSFSVQSAGGSLAYVNHLQIVADEQNTFDLSMDEHLETLANQQPAEKPIHSEDVMDLIRARMQRNNQ